MAFFDNFKFDTSKLDNLKFDSSRFDGILKSFTDVSDSVTKKSNSVLEIQKSRIKNLTLQSELKDLFTEIGQLFFEETDGTDVSPEMAELLEKVKACMAAIESETSKINDLKGVVICPGCGVEVDAEASFCSKCGTAIPKPEPVVEEEEPCEEEEAEAEAPAKDEKVPPRCSEEKGDGFRKYKTRLQ